MIAAPSISVAVVPKSSGISSVHDHHGALTVRHQRSVMGAASDPIIPTGTGRVSFVMLERYVPSPLEGWGRWAPDGGTFASVISDMAHASSHYRGPRPGGGTGVNDAHVHL